MITIGTFVKVKPVKPINPKWHWMEGKVKEVNLEGDAFTVQLRNTLKERMEKIVEGFNSVDGFSCRKPEGSFYAFPKVTDHEDYTSSKDFCEHIFDKQKLALVPGSEFGPSGEGYLRASFGSSSLEEIDETIQRLQQL